LILVLCNQFSLLHFIEYIARTQDKFILLADTLSPRQLNCVRSLVRLGSEPSVRPVLSEQVKQINYLTSSEFIPYSAYV